MSADHPAHNPPTGQFLQDRSRPYATVADSESTNSASAQPIPPSMDWQPAPPAVSSPKPQTKLQLLLKNSLFIHEDTTVAGGHAQGTVEFFLAFYNTRKRQSDLLVLIKNLLSLYDSPMDHDALQQDSEGVMELRALFLHTMHAIIGPFVGPPTKRHPHLPHNLSASTMNEKIGNQFGKSLAGVFESVKTAFRGKESEADAKEHQRWCWPFHLPVILKATFAKYSDASTVEKYNYSDRTPEKLFGMPDLEDLLGGVVDEAVEGIMRYDLDEQAGLEMKDPQGLWWEGGLNLQKVFSANPALKGIKTWSSFTTNIGGSRGGLTDAIMARAFAKVHRIRALSETSDSSASVQISEFKTLIGFTSRPTPAQDVVEFSQFEKTLKATFEKTLKATSLLNSTKPFASPLSPFAPSDSNYAGADWKVYEDLDPSSNGQKLCAAVAHGVTDALQSDFDRLLDDSGLTNATMSRSCSRANEFLSALDNSSTRSEGEPDHLRPLSTEHFDYRRVRADHAGGEDRRSSFKEAIDIAKEKFQPKDPALEYANDRAKFQPKKVDIGQSITRIQSLQKEDVDSIVKKKSLLRQVGALLLSSESQFSVMKFNFTIAEGVANLTRAKARLDQHKTALGTSYKPLLRLVFVAALASLLSEHLLIVSIYVNSAADNIWSACQTSKGQEIVEIITKDIRGMLLRFGIESTKERGTNIRHIAKEFNLPSTDPRWYNCILAMQGGHCFMHAESCRRKLVYRPHERLKGTIIRDGEKISVGVLERRSSNGTKVDDNFSNWEHYPCPYHYFVFGFNEGIAHLIARFAYLYHVTDRPGRGKPREGAMGGGQPWWEVLIDQGGGEEEAEDEEGNVKDKKEASDEEMSGDEEERNDDEEVIANEKEDSSDEEASEDEEKESSDEDMSEYGEGSSDDESGEEKGSNDDEDEELEYLD